MRLLVFRLLLCSGISSSAFLAPVTFTGQTVPSSLKSPLSTSTTILKVSSSLPPEDGSDKPKGTRFNEEGEIEVIDDDLLLGLVQGALVLVAAGVSISIVSAISSTLGNLVASTSDILSQEITNSVSVVVSGFGSLLASMLVAIWHGLEFVVPIIFKAAYEGIQAALPVLNDGFSQLFDMISPYLEGTRSEMSQVASPYVEQINGAFHEAADATVIESVQKAAESFSRTVDSAIFVPIQEFQQAVDSNIISPVKDIQASMIDAVDEKLAPIRDFTATLEDAKTSVGTAVEQKIVAPIQQLQDALEKTVPTSFSFRVPIITEISDSIKPAVEAVTDQGIEPVDSLLDPDVGVVMNWSK